VGATRCKRVFQLHAPYFFPPPILSCNHFPRKKRMMCVTEVLPGSAVSFFLFFPPLSLFGIYFTSSKNRGSDEGYVAQSMWIFTSFFSFFLQSFPLETLHSIKKEIMRSWTMRSVNARSSSFFPFLPPPLLLFFSFWHSALRGDSDDQRRQDGHTSYFFFFFFFLELAFSLPHHR